MLKENTSRTKLILVVGIAIITFCCYYYTLQNQFVNWDDSVYIRDNPYIKDLTAKNLKMILFHNITNNYYHPITMLSIAANYHFSQMNPFGYYFTNVILHVINTCLIFLLVIVLLKTMEEKGYGQMQGKEWLAALAALFHGVHPMHVESVAWISERKDVLYELFYFLGLIAYVKYVKEEKIKWLIYVVLLYMCSLASKPLAVVFPFSLFAIDILLKREGIKKLLVEKIPFFLVSLAAGIWAWKTADASGSIASFQTLSIFERLMFAGFSFTMYAIKAFAPFHLCSYYPYPGLDNSGYLPFYFYIAPVTALAIIGVPLYLTYRADKNYFRVALFGLSFFLVNVIFILQFVSVGPAIMADRYTSIAYFGIFFMVVYALQQLWTRLPKLHTVYGVVMIAFVCVLSFLCYQRTKVWHDTVTLWKDVAKKYPGRVEEAYMNLGNYYFGLGEMDDAFNNYKTAIGLDSKDARVYCNIGNIYAMKGERDKSLASYAQSLKLDSNYFQSYLDRGVTYSSIGEYEVALKDYNRAYQIDSTSEKLLGARANNYIKIHQYTGAVSDYSHLLRISPDNALYYKQKAIAESYNNNMQESINDFTYALKLEPGNKDFLFDISVQYNKMGDYTNALNYALKAKQAGYDVPENYINKLQQNIK